MTARCMALGSCPDPVSYAVQMMSNWTVSGAITASDVTLSGMSQCYSSQAGYAHFSMVTITSPSLGGASATAAPYHPTGICVLPYRSRRAFVTWTEITGVAIAA